MDKQSLVKKYFQRSHLLTTDNPRYCRNITRFFQWLTDSDKCRQDLTTKLLDLPKKSRAVVISRQDGVVAGVEEVGYLLTETTNLTLKRLTKDGEKITKNQKIVEISGPAGEILSYERIILNILQRMSGIATITASLINHGPYIAATRKTPWMLIDKKAVAVGGGLTHRLDLSDGILIKDNHLSIKKLSLEKILETVLLKTKNKMIEVEIQKENQAPLVIDIFNKTNKNNFLTIMFDNFASDKVTSTINKLKKSYDLSKIIFEASGGINKDNLSKWVKTGVDFISLGDITHSVKSLDLSLEFVV